MPPSCKNAIRPPIRAEYYWLIEFLRPNQLIIPRLAGFQIAKVRGANRQSGRGGIRTFVKNLGEYAIHQKTGTESGTVDTENGPIDADLQQLITLWPQLAASVREALLQQATQSLTRGP